MFLLFLICERNFVSKNVTFRRIFYQISITYNIMKFTPTVCRTVRRSTRDEISFGSFIILYLCCIRIVILCYAMTLCIWLPHSFYFKLEWKYLPCKCTSVKHHKYYLHMSSWKKKYGSMEDSNWWWYIASMVVNWIEKI